MQETLRCGDQVLDLTAPKIMGILNVTPDSFSDGGFFMSVDKALQQAAKMQNDGAAIIDIGGESSRPGAADVSEQEELDRVIPVIESIHHEINTIISIDTSKPRVMQEAVSAGASMINDVNALRADNAINVTVQSNVPVCLMHMKGKPRTMQAQPNYTNVVSEVKSFLAERATCCQNAGLKRSQIVLDPGFGFGKSVEHNLELTRHLDELVSLGYPVLIGMSRKSTIGTLLGNRPADERLYGSSAFAAIALWKGANIIRVHDVAATHDVMKVCTAIAKD